MFNAKKEKFKNVFVGKGITTMHELYEMLSIL